MSVPAVPTDEALALLADASVTVIDVRRADEVARGALAGAIHLDIADPAFGDRIAELDPAGRYALYCRSGNRSGMAAARLRAAGFVDAVNIGGYEPLVRAGAATGT